VSVGEAQEPGLRTEPEQGLHHSERDQLGVGELGRDPDRRAIAAQFGVHLQLVIDSHVECRAQGVQIGVHETSGLKGLGNADLGRLFRVAGGPGFTPEPLESLV
jgi:hypothetical protein